MSNPLRRSAILPQVPAAVAALLEPALLEVAGEGAAPVSLALDFGAALPAGATVTIEAQVERMTRTLVFASARLLGADGALAANASAVFRRVQQVTSAS